MANKAKAITVFKESDVLTLTAQHLAELQSNQGTKFKVWYIDEQTIHIKIGPQSFALTVKEQSKFS